MRSWCWYRGDCQAIVWNVLHDGATFYLQGYCSYAKCTTSFHYYITCRSAGRMLSACSWVRSPSHTDDILTHSGRSDIPLLDRLGCLWFLSSEAIILWGQSSQKFYKYNISYAYVYLDNLYAAICVKTSRNHNNWLDNWNRKCGHFLSKKCYKRKRENIKNINRDNQTLSIHQLTLPLELINLLL